MKNHIKINFFGKRNYFWGLLLLLVGILLIVDGLGFELDLFHISVPRIALGVLFAAWMLNDLLHARFASLFLPAAFLFMVFEREIAHLVGAQSDNLISNWVLLLAAILLTIAVKILFPHRRRPHKGFIEIETGGKNVRIDTDKINGASRDEIENAFGNITSYIDAKDLGHVQVENALGRTEVFIENAEAYTGDGTISIDNALGQTTVHIPADWHVSITSDVALGAVKNSMPGNPNGKVLHIHAECALGMIELLPL